MNQVSGLFSRSNDFCILIETRSLHFLVQKEEENIGIIMFFRQFRIEIEISFYFYQWQIQYYCKYNILKNYGNIKLK